MVNLLQEDEIETLREAFR